MGWRGTVRSVSAAMRAADRDSQRRNKQRLKELEFQSSAEAVAERRELINGLTGIHTVAADYIDWHSVATKSKPCEPMPTNERTTSAKLALDAFRPSRLDFIRGGTKRRLEKLTSALRDAENDDARENLARFETHENDVDEWESDRDLAERLLSKQIEAQRDVIQEYQSLSCDDRIGSQISFLINDDFLHAMVDVHTEGVIPDTRLKQLASGRLSETKMPQSEFNELYQDYVCSVAIRVATDLFNLVPISECYVTCRANMLNGQTGHLQQTPIISVFFVRETLRNLNLANIDPSDAMANFIHHMSFKRSQGFQEIVPLKRMD